MRLVFSPIARQDLLEIGDYIAQDNPARALSFVDELEDSCRGLLETPLRFPLVEEFAHLGYRRRVHARYIIIYAVEGDEIGIVRVISSAMDLAKALG
jgi:plasmid stabilization system protein ParE